MVVLMRSAWTVVNPPTPIRVHLVVRWMLQVTVRFEEIEGNAPLGRPEKPLVIPHNGLLLACSGG